VSLPHRPQWQLPQGVPPGLWRYTQSDQVANEYDDYFAQNWLFEFDEQVLARHFSRPGLVVDLGCGTGRALLPLARRGFPCLAVDLSMPMLRIVGEKSSDEGLPVGRIRANLVELDCIRADSADYCLCLFSTLGMIHGAGNRQKVLDHARRILKPDGLLVVHVHNYWYNLFDPAGRRWLARSLAERLFSRHLERGDKFFPYRGIPNMYLHTFSRDELIGTLDRSQFSVRELIPLSATRQRPLGCPWLFGRLRANGWIAVCG